MSDRMASDKMTTPMLSQYFVAEWCSISTRKKPKSNLNKDDKDDTVPNTDFQDIAKLGILQVADEDGLGRKVIVVSACRLPPAGQLDYERFLQYLQHTLEKLVENDYTLVYFHYGLTDQNQPSFGWLQRAYNEFDRKYKKNLKEVYIVHPSSMLKSVLTVFKPLISMKFGKKLTNVNNLHELAKYVQLDEKLIPKRVKDFDASLVEQNKSEYIPLSPQSAESLPKSAPSLPQSTQASLHSALPLPKSALSSSQSAKLSPNFAPSSLQSAQLSPQSAQLSPHFAQSSPHSASSSPHSAQSSPYFAPSSPQSAQPLPKSAQSSSKKQFGVGLDILKKNNNGDVIPPIVKHCVNHIRQNGMETKEIFSKSVNIVIFKALRKKLDNGETVDYAYYGGHSIPAMILNRFLRELPEPILTFNLYLQFIKAQALDAEAKMREMRRLLSKELPDDNYYVLKYIIKFFNEVVASYPSVNVIRLKNLAVVYGKNLLRSSGYTSKSDLLNIVACAEAMVLMYNDIFIK